MSNVTYEDNVFINCPFDIEYKSLFYSIVFTIHDAGFLSRCSLEESNSGKSRFEKIKKIISECKYGIHDISRTELDNNFLPRFNMPFELGVFVGAMDFGKKKDSLKSILILDVEKYRYQKFLSDIAGRDIKGHNNSEEEVIKAVRDWLRIESKCMERKITQEDLFSNFIEFRDLLIAWLQEF
ncbi:MAG: hypothetical protein SFU25_03500 [Candidatus Caenarcaniphilales bacterium]|nr:hypothetical protein [Candidatus Caenarcaniphilales bacterium]